MIHCSHCQKRLQVCVVARKVSAEPYAAVGIAFSAGGLLPCRELLAALPETFHLPIFVVQHLSNRFTSRLPEILSWSCALPARWAVNNERPEAGSIYVAPPDRHLLISRSGLLTLSSADRVHHSRPAADPLFESMAQTLGPRSISVVLSGLLRDGSRGTAAIRACGGLTMAQDERSSEFFDMPSAAIDYGKAEVVFAPRGLASALDAAIDQGGPG
jgi:two-component system, chemotaxis family, protein-glutamate methylesterase/glutaminase